MQTRKQSLKEVVCSVVIGYLVGLIANLLVLPLFGYNVNVLDGMGIAVIFSAISIARSYIVRRIFNRIDK
jgi:hypothetical protein